ncbi:MAG TPA: SCO family protein [Burkholderiales bacterium]|nr:SCO family protein [Burkholderiales bacterium]
MSIWPLFSPRCWSIITCSLALAACDGAPKFRSTDITGAEYGRSLELPDTSGRVRHLEDFRGKAVVLSFGFTHCPDVCPTTLADLATVIKSLGPDAERVQVLFVTVDPERDTPGDLEKYVGAFDPRFLALRGDPAATQRVAKDFKIYFEKRKQGDTYTVDHSAQSYVIDPQGRLRLLVRHDRLAQDLPDDLRVILKQG